MRGGGLPVALLRAIVTHGNPSFFEYTYSGLLLEILSQNGSAERLSNLEHERLPSHSLQCGPADEDATRARSLRRWSARAPRPALERCMIGFSLYPTYLRFRSRFRHPAAAAAVVAAIVAFTTTHTAQA